MKLHIYMKHIPNYLPVFYCKFNCSIMGLLDNLLCVFNPVHILYQFIVPCVNKSVQRKYHGWLASIYLHRIHMYIHANKWIIHA